MKYFLLALLVSAPALAAKQGIAARGIASADKWTCAGTEPFWDLKIEGKKAKLDSPAEEMKSDFSITQKVNPSGSVSEGYGFVLRAKGAKGEAVITLRSNKCNDGMSEKEWSHEVMVLTEDRLLVGCCNHQ